MERAWGELREVAEDMVKLVGRLGKVGWATMLHWEIKDRRRLRRLCLYYSDYHFKFIYLMLSMSLEQQRRGWRLGGLPLATHIFALPYLGWEMPLPSSLGGGNIFFLCLGREEQQTLSSPGNKSSSYATAVEPFPIDISLSGDLFDYYCSSKFTFPLPSLQVYWFNAYYIIFYFSIDLPL